MPSSFDRVVYISGVHGSGKSTLVDRLADLGLIRHDREHSVKLEDTFERMMWRVCKHWLEAKDQERLAIENPEKIILGNRCRYDHDAYAAGFLRLGWMTAEQEAQHQEALDAFFQPQYLPRKIIYLSPPKGWVEERLIERWKKEPKKWHEDNFEYLHAVMDAFEEVYSNHPCDVLRLTETDIERRVKTSIEWIETADPGRRAMPNESLNYLLSGGRAL